MEHASVEQGSARAEQRWWREKRGENKDQIVNKKGTIAEPEQTFSPELCFMFWYFNRIRFQFLQQGKYR